MGESITKSELRRSCSLDFLLMAKVVLLQSHPICTSGFQEGLLGQRRPSTLVRQRLVAPPSNSQLSPTSHLFSLSTKLSCWATCSHHNINVMEGKSLKTHCWCVSVHVRSSDSEPIHIEQQTNTCINPVIIFAFSKSRMLQSQTAIWKYSIQI